MEYQFIWQPNRLVVRFTGLLDVPGLVKMATDVIGDRRFDEVTQLVHDYSECDGVASPGANLDEFVVYTGPMAHRGPELKVAVIAEREDVKAMVGRFLDYEYCTFPVQVFQNLETADAWLNS